MSPQACIEPASKSCSLNTYFSATVGIPPSPFINLKSHLLRRHLLWTAKFRTPNPPWSFGIQTTSHFVNLYFFLCSSLCQKKLRSKIIQFFQNPSRYFKERHHKHRKTTQNRVNEDKPTSHWKHLTPLTTQSLLKSFFHMFPVFIH
jgi:hypothetical protein